MAIVLPDPRFEMPELFIPGRKPVGSVQIDRSNQLARGLIEYYLFKDFKSLFGRDFTPNNTDYIYPTVNHGKQELAVETTGITDFAEATYDPFVEASSPITILAGLRTDIALADEMRVLTNDGTASILLRFTAGINAEFIINSLTNDRVSHSINVSSGESYVVGGSWGGSGTYINVISKSDTDGLKITANGLTSSGTYTTGTHLFNAGSKIKGGYEWFGAWNRQLSNVEITQFINNPYQFLVPA